MIQHVAIWLTIINISKQKTHTSRSAAPIMRLFNKKQRPIFLCWMRRGIQIVKSPPNKIEKKKFLKTNNIKKKKRCIRAFPISEIPGHAIFFGCLFLGLMNHPPPQPFRSVERLSTPACGTSFTWRRFTFVRSVGRGRVFGLFFHFGFCP